MRADRGGDIAARVARERASGEIDDVLAHGVAIKNRFPHSWTVLRRVWRDEAELLTDVAGHRVLDYGCGTGEGAVALIAAGAIVEGIDIVPSYIEACRARIAGRTDAEGRARFQVMDAHTLAFPDKSFDCVVGNGILHHLDLGLALGEIRRVLKPGGRAVFQEPLAGNPLLTLFRRLTPSARSADERPLTRRDLAAIERDWQMESRYYGLVSAPVAMVTSILLRPWPDNVLLTGALAWERGRFISPAWRSLHQYVLLDLIRPAD